MKVNTARPASSVPLGSAPTLGFRTGPQAFGYLGDTRQLDPQTAPLVKQAYADVLAGASLSGICRQWNADGVRTLTGKPWTAETLTKFIRKPRNAGLRAYKGEIVGKGTWPPLVDESIWRAAQAVLDAPGRAPDAKPYDGIC